MKSWNLTRNVDVQSSTPTIKHNSYGDCYIETTSVIPIYAVWIEVSADDTAATVQIVFEPGSGVDPIDDSLVVVTKVPATHGGAATWGTITVGGRVCRTLDFDIPTSGTMWGWDFEPGAYPPPLKMKVRVKRL